LSFEKEDLDYMHDWLYNYINDYCIYRVAPGEENLPPLHPSHAPNGYSWYIQSRIGLLNSQFLKYVSILFWHNFLNKYKEQRFQLAGLETASIPLMTGISMMGSVVGINDLNTFYVRKQAKSYGLMQQYEGIIEPDVPVVIVDDFFNSRSTFVTVKNFVESQNVPVDNNAFAVIDKRWELYDSDNPDDFRLQMRKQSEGFNIVSLFDVVDFDLSYTSYHTKKFKDEQQSFNS